MKCDDPQCQELHAFIGPPMHEVCLKLSRESKAELAAMKTKLEKEFPDLGRIIAYTPREQYLGLEKSTGINFSPDQSKSATKTPLTEKKLGRKSVSHHSQTQKRRSVYKAVEEKNHD